MKYDLKVPESGFSVPEATVMEWCKEIGDHVHEGETVVSIETDKINVELPAPASGILTEIRAQPGDVVAVGDILGVVTSQDETAAAATGEAAESRDLPAPQLSAAALSSEPPAAISKDRPLLLKSSRVSGLRRTATIQAPALSFQATRTGPNEV